MSIIDTIAELAEQVKPERITRENVDALLDAGQIQIGMANGGWWDIQRNGATQQWKRDPARIRIPFKYGFKFANAITEDMFSVDNALNPEHFRVKPPAGVE